MEEDDFNPNQLININDDKNNNKNFFKKFFSVDSNKNSTNSFDILNEEETNENSIKNNNKNEKNCKEKLLEKITNSIEIEKNYTIFCTLLLLGTILIFISFLLIPMIITSPSKFTLCFSLGSILIIVSFLFFHGTKIYFQKLFKKDRFVISILFLVSIIVGCVCSIKKYYLICIICSIIEMFSLVLFLVSFVPGGGKFGIKCLKNIFTSPFRKIFIKKISNEINK
jgi:hypothetical protein